MGLGDHINLHLKQGVKIITCDPATSTIEAETRNGEVISVNVYHFTPTFRWPVPGEKWTVVEENGSWFLDGIYEQQALATTTYPNFDCDATYVKGDIVKFHSKLWKHT